MGGGVVTGCRSHHITRLSRRCESFRAIPCSSQAQSHGDMRVIIQTHLALDLRAGAAAPCGTGGVPGPGLSLGSASLRWCEACSVGTTRWWRFSGALWRRPWAHAMCVGPRHTLPPASQRGAGTAGHSPDGCCYVALSRFRQKRVPARYLSGALKSRFEN